MSEHHNDRIRPFSLLNRPKLVTPTVFALSTASGWPAGLAEYPHTCSRLPCTRKSTCIPTVSHEGPSHPGFSGKAGFFLPWTSSQTGGSETTLFLVLRRIWLLYQRVALVPEIFEVIVRGWVMHGGKDGAVFFFPPLAKAPAIIPCLTCFADACTFPALLSTGIDCRRLYSPSHSLFAPFTPLADHQSGKKKWTDHSKPPLQQSPLTPNLVCPCALLPSFSASTPSSPSEGHGLSRIIACGGAMHDRWRCFWKYFCHSLRAA